jgi:8-oxo-dGTP pyrophosphatase MutT (NUDIX family)
MDKLLKIGTVVFAFDPDGILRILLRHNRPFNNNMDHWTIVSGTVDPGESFIEAATRELIEEFGISEIIKMIDLDYKKSLIRDDIELIISYFAVEVKNIDVKITLDFESIGYNWCTIEEAIVIIQEDFVKEALFKLNFQLGNRN